MNSMVVERVRATPLRLAARRGGNRSTLGAGWWYPTIICVELRGGTAGYGELAGGADAERTSVPAIERTLTHVFGPDLLSFHPTSLPEALEAIEALPVLDERGVEVRSLRAAVELALLDAVLRAYRRGVEDVVRWMGLPGFGRSGSQSPVRYGVSVEAKDPRATLAALRRWYWFGVRDFRIAVGNAGDLASIEAAAGYLKHPIMQERAWLRADAEGRWTREEALHWIAETAGLGLAALEQPLPRGSEADLPIVEDVFDGALVFDESLVDMADAMRLSGLGLSGVYRIGINKCGGLIPALRLAAAARRENRDILLGGAAMETSLLAGAGMKFLEVCPGVRWAEWGERGWGTGGDVCRPALRPGWAGRPPKTVEAGMGISVDRGLVDRWTIEEPLVLKM